VLKCYTGKASNHCHHFLSKDGELVYCNDAEGLLQELGCTHIPEDWRLFVDSCKFSSKAVPLYNGNTHIHLSTPFARCVHMKESCDIMDLLLKGLSYSKYEWDICGVLTIVE